jgi:hypothetical protein
MEREDRHDHVDHQEETGGAEQESKDQQPAANGLGKCGTEAPEDGDEVRGQNRADETPGRRAALQLGADYVFILGYAPLLALLSGLGALQLGAYWQPLATFGVLVAWGQLLAGLLDMVEDLGLIQVLAGTRNEAWPRLARYCAQAKFSLVGLGITVGLFGLYALVQKLVG